MIKRKQPCILCGSETTFFRVARKRRYFQCSGCSSVMMDPQDYVSIQKEKARYETHNNDVNDRGYQHFVSPVVERILQ
ncbi:MAG: hypothetical protein KGY70_20475, partial [Bacteroidales bacterium]|nr:hypothetical protein [Bacteroidales bacterium]